MGRMHLLGINPALLGINPAWIGKFFFGWW
jgi:hypothetical protein